MRIPLSRIQPNSFFMNNRSFLWLCWLFLVCIGWQADLGHAAEPLRIGVAETDITPPNGYPMSGYYHERLATGAMDPLKAHAIVFRQGTEQAALVTCDLTGIAKAFAGPGFLAVHEWQYR